MYGCVWVGGEQQLANWLERRNRKGEKKEKTKREEEEKRMIRKKRKQTKPWLRMIASLLVLLVNFVVVIKMQCTLEIQPTPDTHRLLT